MPKMCCDLALESLTSAIGGLPRADRCEGCAHAIEDGGPSGSRRARGLALSSLALRARAAAVRRTPAPLRVRDPGTENENAGRFRPARAIEDGGPSGSRTLDLGIKSPLLCQLS